MDEIVRMTAVGAPVKVIAMTGKNLTERARQIHGLLPTGTAALGRTLMGTSMIGASLKGEDDAVTVRIKGGGPLGALCCVADSAGNVRGYAQYPEADVPSKYPGKLDVGGAVGKDGFITVIKDMGLKEPYVGSVQLVSGEIAEDFTAYFAESEQVPSACALGVLVARDHSVAQAGGVLIQLLPGAAEGDIAAVERGLASLGTVTQALETGLDAEGLARAALPDFTLELLERAPVEYRCQCSRARVSRALISLGQEELEAMIREQEGAELTCQFCDVVYYYTSHELGELLKRAK